MAFRSPDGRLDSWKAIAAYLNRDVSTVIRWEREKSLPVHRVPGGRRQAVFARAAEIDAWLSGQPPEREAGAGETSAAPVRRWRTPALTAIGLGGAVLAAVLIAGANRRQGTLVVPGAPFLLGQQITVQSPYTLAAGDLNTDGALDFVATAYPTGTLYTFLGRGDGTFRTGDSVATGRLPDGVALADLTGDGFLDAVTANRGSNSISVFTGSPAGVFTDRRDYPTGAAPRGVAAGDLDGNGTVDVAVANFDGSSITVLRNAGGQLGDPVTYTVGLHAYRVRIADFNRDDVMDLAATNAGESAPAPVIVSLSVLLGAGHGTFRRGAQYPLGSGPSGLAVGDFEGDGLLDLAATGFDEHLCFVLAGNGDGTFGAPAKFASGVAPVDVQTADFDGDFVPDLVTANAHGNSVSFFHGRGDGVFEGRTDVPVGTYAKSVAVGDVNGDARPDLVVTSYYGNAISVLLNADGHD